MALPLASYRMPQIIAEVKARPILWDHGHAEFSHNNTVAEEWQQIAVKLNIPSW